MLGKARAIGKDPTIASEGLEYGSFEFRSDLGFEAFRVGETRFRIWVPGTGQESE